MADASFSGATPRWQVKHGLMAMAVCVLCAEGVVAGSDRSCMPSFDLGILAGQMLMLNMFGAPEIWGIVAGIPAFVIAAYPETINFRRRWLPLVFAVLAAGAICLVALGHSGWLGLLFVGGTLGVGALIGFWIRASEKFRRFWFPIGILLALLAGGIIFSFGHYGQNNCWP